MIHRSRRTLGLGVLFASLAFFALVAAPAFAERTYDSQITGFSEPWGLTIDSSDNLWVSDTGNKGLISEYNSYPSQSRIGEQTGEGRFSCSGLYTWSLAVNNTNDNLYVAESCGVGVLVFDPAGHFLAPKWGGFYVYALYVAIDNSGGPSNGRVYAADPLGDEPYGVGFVKAFDPNHNEVNFEASEPYINGSEITGPPGGTFEFQGITNIAVDNNGNLYVVESTRNEVEEFEASGKFVQAFTGGAVPGGFGALTGVAVDPTNENVLIVDRNKDVVDEFSSSGEYLGRITGTSPISPFGDLRGGIAVNSNGYVYVADHGRGAVDIFTPKSVLPKATYLPVTNPTPTSEKLKAVVDPHGGGPVTACQFEYGLDKTYSLGSIPCSPDPGSSPPASHFTEPTTVVAEPSGLTSETMYHYRIAISNANGISHGQDKTFTPHWVSNLTTEPATNLQATSASLPASYIGNGEDTHYEFEYGTDTNYGQTTPLSDAGSGTGPLTVTPVEIVGLQPLTTYHYRVVATNSLGTTYGQDQLFTTLAKPTIGNFSSANVTATTAVLHADINPQGADTHYHFDYGTTSAYGSAAPVPAEDIGSSRESQHVTVQLTNLQAGATYHFRVVAENAFGTTASEDQTFGFYPPSCPNAHIRQETHSSNLPDCRAYELVSPSNAGGTTLFPEGPFAPQATNPARFAFGGFLGTIPGVGDPPNDFGDLYVSTRTDQGWITKYVGIPATVAHAVNGPPGEPNLGFLGNSPAGVRTDVSMDKILDWNDGNEPNGEFGGPEYAPFWAPHLWAADGSSLGVWPTVPKYAAGPIFNQSPDFTHYYFETEGVVYDNNTALNTISPIATETDGTPLPIHGIPQTSTDGRHVLMSTGGCGDPAITSCSPGELYMRVNDAITHDIAKGHVVRYVGMTADASKVYFTSAEQLTPADEDSSTDLYMWSEKGEEEGTPLVLVSVGKEGRGNSDACAAKWTTSCGVVPYENNFFNVHFDRGAVGGNGLSDNAIAESDGDIYFYSPEILVSGRGVKDQQNLYLYRNGQLQFVTTFAPGSFCDEKESRIDQETCSAGPMVRIQVSPDDSHMAFLTVSKVTAYNNVGHSEMYTYTPSTEEVKCVSCIPGGEPPHSDVWASMNGTFMANDGRTFFSTSDALVPQDTDQLRDVYEYVEGRPQLISSGTSSKDATPNISIGINEHLFSAGLVGVSADGANVYFSTYDTLVPQDHNGAFLKFYDARTDGGFAFATPPAPCAAADECVGPGSSPAVVPPESSGAELGSGGNVKSRPGPARHRNRAKHHVNKGHHRGGNRRYGIGRRNG